MQQLKYTPYEFYKIKSIYEYYDQPIIYSFYDTKGFLYVATWADTNSYADIWITVPVLARDLRHFETGELSLLELFKNNSYTYVLEDTGDCINYSVGNFEDIPLDFLPDADYFITENSREISVNSHIESGLVILQDRVTSNNKYVVDISLEPQDSHENEIGAHILGQTLTNFQSLVNSLSLDNTADVKSKIPHRIKKETALNVVGTFAASFGVRLESEIIANLLNDDLVGKSLEKVDSMLRIAYMQDKDSKLEALNEFSPKAINKFLTILKDLAENEIGIKVTSGLPIGGLEIKQYSNHLSSSQSKKLVNELYSTIKVESLVSKFEGTLFSYNSNNGKFKFVTTDDNLIEGDVLDYQDRIFTVPSVGVVELSVTNNIRLFDRSEKKEYSLLTFEIKEN